MSRKENEKRYFRAVRQVARLKSQLYILGSKQSLLEDEVNKATAEVVRFKAAINNALEMTAAEIEIAHTNRIAAIKAVRERLPNLELRAAKDLVDQTVPPTYRS